MEDKTMEGFIGSEEFYNIIKGFSLIFFVIGIYVFLSRKNNHADEDKDCFDGAPGGPEM